MEYLQFGDLESNLKERADEKNPLEEVEFKDILTQILKGVEIMHKENVLHRDLKRTFLSHTKGLNGRLKSQT